METPTTHCSDSELARYAQRALPWREVLRVDGHLKGCPECATRLTRRANVRRAGALLRAVSQDDPHLTYEQMEAVAEGRLQLGAALKVHAGECSVCKKELRDMREFVAAFRAAKLRPAAAAAAGGSWLDVVRHWFESPRQISAAAAVIATVTVGSLLASHTGFMQSGGGSSNGSATSAHAVATDSPRHVSGAFEDCVARELAAHSPEWSQLYRSGNYPQLVDLLREAAGGGSALAQAALALLSAKGLGTDADPNAARSWVQRAAAQGDVCARRGLSAVN